MSRTTNAGRAVANILRRAELARETGRWPPWKWHNPYTLKWAHGWLAEVTKFAENGVFSVLMRDFEAAPIGIVSHAAISSIGHYTDITWAERQKIKNELFGRERAAVEVMPPESELVDGANMYHIWVMPPGYVMPFTLATRDIGNKP